MRRVLVITGGNSSERSISLKSAKQVQTALVRVGYQVKLFDLKLGYQQLDHALCGCDVIFPVLHGKDGEDGTLYRFLNSHKLAYVGSDPKGAKIAFNKILFKKYCDKKQLPTAKWSMVKEIADISKFGFPCVLKAAQGGSSKEVVILSSVRDLKSVRVKNLLRLNDQFYIEAQLVGIEITVGVLDGRSLPAIEITPPSGKWFDYHSKYSGITQEVVGAPSVLEPVVVQAQKLALAIHRDLDLGQYSRTDFIVVGDTPVILEINTPGGVGMTPQSLFPKAAQAAGISFVQLVDHLVKLAVSN